MVLFGERLNGTQAAEAGIAWKCVPDDELLNVAIEYAQKAAAAPKGLVARTKQTFASLASVEGSQQAVDLETTPQFWAMQQQEFKDWVTDLKARISSKSKK